MAEKLNSNGKIKLIELLAGIIVGVSLSWSGWSTLQTVDIKAAMAAQDKQIKINTTELFELRTQGSPGLATHERDDNTRVIALQQRVALLETDLRYAIDLKNEVGKLGVRLDERLAAIADRLKKLEETSAIVKKP